MDRKNINDNVNVKLYNRNVPSDFLETQLSARPLSTKYNLNPSKNQDYKDNKIYKNFDIKQTFNPGTQGPWSGFAKHVNDESILKNQIFALQRSSQSVWVPSSNSDLYENHLPPMDSGLLMFKKLPPQENTSKAPTEKSYWNNHTRNDILDIH